MIISIVCLSARMYVYMCTVHVRKKEFVPVRVAMYAQRKRDIYKEASVRSRGSLFRRGNHGTKLSHRPEMFIFRGVAITPQKWLFRFMAVLRFSVVFHI